VFEKATGALQLFSASDSANSAEDEEEAAALGAYLGSGAAGSGGGARRAWRAPRGGARAPWARRAA